MPDEITPLLEKYIPQLVRLADLNIGSHLRGKVEADDVVASACRTFLRRYGSRSFRVDAEADVWKLLVAISLNKVRQKARRLSAEKRDIRRECSVERLDLVQSLRTPPGPAEAAEFADLVTVVASALDRVAAQVLQLVLEGETRAEIAEHLGISTRTVSRKLAVIRDELRRVECHA